MTASQVNKNSHSEEDRQSWQDKTSIFFFEGGWMHIILLHYIYSMSKCSFQDFCFLLQKSECTSPQYMLITHFVSQNIQEQNQNALSFIQLSHLLPSLKFLVKKSLKYIICCSLKCTWLAMFCMILETNLRPRLHLSIGFSSTMPCSYGDTVEKKK